MIVRRLLAVGCLAALVVPRDGRGAEPGRFVPVAEAIELSSSGTPLAVPAIVPASFFQAAEEVEVFAAAGTAADAAPPAHGGAPTAGGAAASAVDAPSGRVDGGDRGAIRPGVEVLPRPKPAEGPRLPTLTPPAEPDLPGSLAIDRRDEPLTLGEVLASVRRHYPLLQAIERERGIAAGQLTAAMGAFDTNINMAGNALAPGTYESYLSDFGLSQLMQNGGVQVFGGWRTGFGSFPTYRLGQKTADIGEFRGGITMPLARDRDIDSARAGRDKARLDRALAEPTIVRSRLDYMRAAALAFWIWQGSGERELAAEQLEELALRRDSELAQKVASGVVANIERIDNQKNIALRRGLLVQADRAVQQATIDLSLFLRDDAGKTLLPARKRMRPLPEPVKPTADVYNVSLSRALAARPEFDRITLEREKLFVERRLAVNETLPGIDAQLVGNQDAGFGKSPLSGPFGLERQVLQASLVFQMPAQRRDARGRLQSLDSQLVQLDRRLQFLTDQVRAQVQDAYSQLERAYEFHKQAVQQEDLATLVAEAEREQFRLGRSDILRVTLREQAKFDADLLEIGARQEYWKADAELRAADTSIDRLESAPGTPGLLGPIPETLFRGGGGRFGGAGRPSADCPPVQPGEPEPLTLPPPPAADAGEPAAGAGPATSR
jgi:cobalt-zinc-cadmium efflux system outer membrane protein